MKILFVIISFFFLNSCLYKAGNRSYDIDYTWNVNISPYYIKKYMKTLDSFYANRLLLTSEIVNYPENFIPITDSVLGYKYVIGFNSYDSLNYIEEHYIQLSSIYDFKKGKWIKDRKELKNNELEKFRVFFKDSVLVKVINQYKNTIPDSLLFVGKSRSPEIKPLRK